MPPHPVAVCAANMHKNHSKAPSYSCRGNNTDTAVVPRTPSAPEQVAKAGREGLSGLHCISRVGPAEVTDGMAGIGPGLIQFREGSGSLCGGYPAVADRNTTDNERSKSHWSGLGIKYTCVLCSTKRCDLDIGRNWGSGHFSTVLKYGIMGFLTLFGPW